MIPSESWQGRAVDYDGQRNRSRSCCVCRHDYTHEELRLDLGWEPLRRGWRCGACGRRWRRRVRSLAVELIGKAEPRWSLVLLSPLHGAGDECFPCEAVTLAQAMLLDGRTLTHSETGELRTAVSKWPGGAAPPKGCAQQPTEPAAVGAALGVGTADER